MNSDPMDFKNNNIHFTTITVNNWVGVFDDFPETTIIVLDSFKFLVTDFGVTIYAFVIMRDHLHVLWRIPSDKKITSIIASFRRYTGKNIVEYFMTNNGDYLHNFSSARKDRKYKFWKTGYGNLTITYIDILQQKLQYIHRNPVKGNYQRVQNIEDYSFSSARAYLNQEANFSFLTVLKDIVW